MVKIPSLDDLKKVGAGLVDSAKSVKLNEMVGKVKSGIETVSSSLKKEAPIPEGDEAIKNLFQSLYASLSELSQMQATQNALIKKVENEISQLAKVVVASQTKEAGSITETPTQDKQTDENTKQ